MKTSNLFSLNWMDALKGLYMAAGGAAFGVLSDSFAKGHFVIDITPMWHAALGASVVYLGKNFFTPATVVTKADVTINDPSSPLTK